MGNVAGDRAGPPEAGFEARMLARLRAQYPRECASLGELELRALIRQGVARAAHYRLVSERDACRFIELLLIFGADVDVPGSRVAAALAAAAPARGSQRLDRAYERAWRARVGTARSQVRKTFGDDPPVLDPLVETTVGGAALSFRWIRAVKLARARETVGAPHWSAGQDLADGAGSLRPAALALPAPGETVHGELALRLDRVGGTRGELRISGRLGAYTLQGSCPAVSGEQRVSLRVSPPPKSLDALQGEVVWQVDGAGLSAPVALANPSRLECYLLLGAPAGFFEPAGVWAEALRFLYWRVGVGGLASPAEVVERIARYCHGYHGLRYDTFHGAPAYGCSGTGGAFQLGAYLAAAKPVVNCYDQAAAVQTLCGALGVAANWFYLRPYGFIQTTRLVGVGDCNNPFYSNNGSSPVVGSEDRQRSAFANHAFAGLDGSVLDACAGPHTGTEDRAGYVRAAIDEATTLYRLYGNFRAGTAPDIIQPDGVTKVV